MSWAAANVNLREQHAQSVQSRADDEADAHNKSCYEAAVRAHHSGQPDDLAYAEETYASLLDHPRLAVNHRSGVSGSNVERLMTRGLFCC